MARTLAWPHLIGMGVGATIGTGIFTLTGIGAGIAGPGVILSFALAGVIVMFAAFAYTEVATLIPTSGSAYTYTYTVFGEAPAWIVGWSLILEYALAASAVAAGWSAHAQQFLADVFRIHLPLALTAGPLEGGIVNVLAVFISLLFTALLLVGARDSARLNLVLVAIKLTALTLFVILAFPAIKAGNYHPFLPFGVLAHEVHGVNVGVAAAAAIIFFAFYGFDAISTTAEEVKNPARDLSIGLLGSIGLCIVYYLAVGTVAIGALPFRVFSPSVEPLPFILRALHHPLAGVAVAAAAIVALPSVILVCIYGQSRIFLVMARDGLLPRLFSHVDRRGLPSRITLVTGIGVAVFAGCLPLGKIATLANSGTLLAFIAVCLAMIVLRLRRPELKRVFRAPLFWLTGPAAVVGCVWLFLSLSHQTMIAFGLWNLLGLAVYFAFGIWNSRMAKPGVELERGPAE